MASRTWRRQQGWVSACGVAALLAGGGDVRPVGGVLVHPERPPMGWNSFDLQWYRSSKGSGAKIAPPAWNESTFRAQARAMAAQLLPHGYDTIVIDGGWSSRRLDDYGRPIPDPQKWPSAAGGKGFAPLAEFAHSLGLKFGLWRIRGLDELAVQNKLPIKGTPYTADEIALECGDDPPFPLSRWCTCTWDQTSVGINSSHAGAQAYYNSVVDLMSEWGVDYIKWDCMYDYEAGYSDEETLALNSVVQSSRSLTLSLSPGDAMTRADASWVGAGQRASLYRATGDFHAVHSKDLSSHVFVVGNLTTAIGRNNTWPDLDMIDLGEYSPYYGTPAAQLHASIWMMARSPLMYAGGMPTDPATLNLLTNPLALLINGHSKNLHVEYEGNCSCQRDRGKTRGYQCATNWPGPDGCVAIWRAVLPGNHCTAIGVFNIGGAPSSTDVSLQPFASSSVQITQVYSGHVFRAKSNFTVQLPALAGELYIAAPGNAADCASA